MATVDALHRFPIKGLSAERLTAMSLSCEAGLAHDCEYALALGTTAFDPKHPEALDKGFLLMLRNNTALAALSTRLDPTTKIFVISREGRAMFEADLSTEPGRAETEAFFADYLGEATRGRPRLVQAENHKFTDASVRSPVMMRAISLVNLASVNALAEAAGRTLETRYGFELTSTSTGSYRGRSWTGWGGNSVSARCAFAALPGRRAAARSMSTPQPLSETPTYLNPSNSTSGMLTSGSTSKSWRAERSRQRMP